jgi:hypothetical protein
MVDRCAAKHCFCRQVSLVLFKQINTAQDINPSILYLGFSCVSAGLTMSPLKRYCAMNTPQKLHKREDGLHMMVVHLRVEKLCCSLS